MLDLDVINRDIDELVRRGNSYSDCERLAVLCIVKDHIKPSPTPTQNITQKSVSGNVSLKDTSQFLKAVNGKNPQAVWDVMDELMSVIQTLHPRLYDRVLKEIDNI